LAGVTENGLRRKKVYITVYLTVKVMDGGFTLAAKIISDSGVTLHLGQATRLLTLTTSSPIVGRKRQQACDCPDGHPTLY
jgi:hypothetical protein